MSTRGTTAGQRWVLALTAAASLMVSLDTQVVATALPVIRLRLHALPDRAERVLLALPDREPAHRLLRLVAPVVGTQERPLLRRVVLRSRQRAG